MEYHSTVADKVSLTSPQKNIISSVTQKEPKLQSKFVLVIAGIMEILIFSGLFSVCGYILTK